MVAMASVPVLGFMALSSAAAALYVGRMVLRTVAPRRGAMAGASVTSIEWFPEGDVGRVVGVTVAVGPPLTAPLTGRACVGYQLEVVSSDDDDRAVLVHEAAWRSFEVVDATGRALVRYDGDDALLDLPTVITSSGLGDDADAAEQAILARHGHVAGARALSYRERAIVVGELVSVRGVGVRQRDPSPTVIDLGRGPPPTQLVLASAPHQRLAISTRPSDLA